MRWNRNLEDLNFTLGLLMGGGSFQINHWKKKYLQYRIIIKLKKDKDNINMLRELRNNYGIGTINISSKFVLWAINHKKEVKWFIKLILKNSEKLLSLSPRTKLKVMKMDYGLNNNLSYNEFSYLEKINRSNWIVIEKEDINIYNYIEDEKFCWWLAGFTEAEGCFCIRKNGNQSFSIGQKIDYEILEIIKILFDLPNTIREQSEKFYVIETYNIKSCIAIIKFFDKYKLRGNKSITYEYFKSHVKSKYKFKSFRNKEDVV